MIIGIQAVITRLKAFIDSFTRADNASNLSGSSSPTNKWITFRGTWGISSNRASTSTAASSYPMAAIKTGAKTARIKVTNGTSAACGYGVAFWITDANNWYGMYSDRTYQQTSDTFACCPPGYTNYNCGGVCSQYSAPWGGDPGHPCAACGCGGCYTYFSGPVGTGCPEGGTLSSSNFGGNGLDECAVCGSTASFTTCTVFLDNYYHYARVMIMASGTASILNSRLVSTTATPATNITSLQVETNTTSQNSIRTSVSIDGGAASTAIVAISAPPQTGTHGVMIGPRTTGTNQPTQSTNLDDFDYSPL